jgi:hypothetical protein
MGRQAAALNLSARDDWTDWSPPGQGRHLDPLMQNSRFVFQGLHAMDCRACPLLETLANQHGRSERLNY